MSIYWQSGVVRISSQCLCCIDRWRHSKGVRGERWVGRCTQMARGCLFLFFFSLSLSLTLLLGSCVWNGYRILHLQWLIARLCFAKSFVCGSRHNERCQSGNQGPRTENKRCSTSIILSFGFEGTRWQLCPKRTDSTAFDIAWLSVDCLKRIPCRGVNQFVTFIQDKLPPLPHFGSSPLLHLFQHRSIYWYESSTIRRCCLRLVSRLDIVCNMHTVCSRSILPIVNTIATPNVVINKNLRRNPVAEVGWGGLGDGNLQEWSGGKASVYRLEQWRHIF